MAGIANTLNGLARAGNGWVLPVAGQEVVQLCLDYAVTLRLINDVVVRIEQPFTITDYRGIKHRVVPDGGTGQLAPALDLVRSTVEDGTAFEDGQLELSFACGIRVLVPAAEDYEPWAVAGPNGLRIVSVPGGELALWLPDG